MEEGFEVRGHDEHLVEHHASNGDTLATRIAVLTAILSTLGAVFSYEGSSAQNEAMLLKNEAVLKKAAADDIWAFYQAKSQKQLITEAVSELVPKERAEEMKQRAGRYASEKEALKGKAEQLDKESETLNSKSERTMQPHHRISQGMTLIQIAIALASIAALTRRRWLVGFACVSAAIGVALSLSGILTSLS